MLLLYFSFLPEDSPSYSLLFLQLEIEVLKPFNATILDYFLLVVKEVPNMISLSSYIQQWRLVVWDTFFFQEFKPKDGIRRSKYWEQQSKSKEAVKRMLYKYSNMSSFSFNHNISLCLQSMANYFLNVCWSA